MSDEQRPFLIEVSALVLQKIQRRLDDTTVTYAPSDDKNWKYGADTRYISSFIEYWRTDYDFRAAERDLNRFSQYKCLVDGIDVHFVHIKGPTPRRTLLLTHGWPGSVYEFYAAATHLTTAGFDLVIPSLPGYGFSARPAKPIGPRRVAALWRMLMVDHLGINRFGVQGGDWGSAVSTWLAQDAPAHVAGLHLNLCSVPTSSDPTVEEGLWRTKLDRMMKAESAYMMEHMTKPQTIALALADNPVGYAAWVLEKFQGWGDTKGDIESRFSKDWLITNLMIHLVNDAVTSMIWMYAGAYQEAKAGGYAPPHVTVPTACALFPAEFWLWPPREAVARHYNVQRWTKMSSGGHFAALEEPEAFAADVAEFFSALPFAA
ncbi:MAG: alpha/beta fold hydrolase [Acidocella sp.]|nr:alpha/beta fold hydrolase [Acidocella sp.]